MEGNESLYEISSTDFLKGKIEYLKNKVKKIREEIKRTEELLEKTENAVIEELNPKQLRIQELNKELNFSVTFWKPKVFNFLFENPSEYTSEQVLIGTDLDKEFQKTKADRDKAIKSISSSLFLLNKEGRVSRISNVGRRGFKWSVNEPTP